jgi:Sulfotransferase family
MSTTPLPNFLIVGAGKAGTTSLYHYIRQHPQIYMSPVKEPGYFAPEIRAEKLSEAMRRHVSLQSQSLAGVLKDGEPTKPYGWIAAEWDDYCRLFRAANVAKAVGEATPAYLWSASAAANIYARLPDAKIIMILRDPAERAFSQYLHQLSVGLTAASFREHLEACARDGHRELSPLYPFLEIGLYHEQVKRFLEIFPRKQIRIYWYEEAWREPAELLADVFRFLEVNAEFRPDLSERSHLRRAPRSARLHHFLKRSGIWYPLRSLVPDGLFGSLRRLAFRSGPSLAMDAADRRYLIDYYRDDIRRLGELLDRDLSGWLR